MKRLFVVRHGFPEDGHLNSLGVEQMKVLGGKIKDRCEGGTVKLISSTTPRASESADVISEILKVVPERNPILCSDNYCERNLKELLTIIKGFEEFDALVVVTYLEWVEILPLYFCSTVLETKIRSTSIEKGEAVSIQFDPFLVEFLCR